MKLEKIYKKFNLVKPQYSDKNYKENIVIDFDNLKHEKFKYSINGEFYFSKELVEAEKNYFSKLVKIFNNDSHESNSVSEKELEIQAISSSKIENIDISNESINKIRNKIQEIKNVEEENIVSKNKIEDLNKELLKKISIKKSYVSSLMLIYSFRTIGKGILRDIYDTFSQNGKIFDENNRLSEDSFYRKNIVGIYNKLGNNLILEGLNYKEVPQAMIYFLNLINNLKANFKTMLSSLSITHLIFETIHPYFDGNGRMGRIIMSWILRLYNVSVQLINIFISLLEANKNRYNRSLLDSQRTRNADYFVSYIYCIYGEAIKIYGFTIIADENYKSLLTISDKTFLISLLKKGFWNKPQAFSDLKDLLEIKLTKKAFFNKMNKLHKIGIIDITGKKKFFFSISKKNILDKLK